MVLMDDGFQHRYHLSPIALFLHPFTGPTTEDYYLPYGRLRESYKEIPCDTYHYLIHYGSFAPWSLG